MIRRLMQHFDCRDDLAHKIARFKGELAAVQHLIEHYTGKTFDPQTQWWQHAEKMQKLKELKEEHCGLMGKLIKLQNRDTNRLKKETENA